MGQYGTDILLGQYGTDILMGQYGTDILMGQYGTDILMDTLLALRILRWLLNFWKNCAPLVKGIYGTGCTFTLLFLC